ncbi:hypothetical protein MRX96_008570 [Rhipicephalus microplus]
MTLSECRLVAGDLARILQQQLGKRRPHFRRLFDAEHAPTATFSPVPCHALADADQRSGLPGSRLQRGLPNHGHGQQRG